MSPDPFIQNLNTAPQNPHGKYVVYWMQSSVRTRDNLALQHALREARILRIPLIVFFELIDNYPEANLRHYTFLLEGLQDIEKSLLAKNISFVVSLKGDARHITLEKLAQEAALVVTDRGYTRFQREWREKTAAELSCQFLQVESDVVVPVEATSPKEEYSAATLRRKITPLLPHYLETHSAKLITPQTPFLHSSFPSLSLAKDAETIARSLKIDTSISPSPLFHGGEQEALKHLRTFLTRRVTEFAEHRNRPELEALSNMSPYLHFGHISPATILLEAQKYINTSNQNYTTLLEELVVRRELAINFVHYNPDYDSFDSLPHWAQRTLEKHTRDSRPYTYTRRQFERAKTHDPYWNAAQTEMLLTGKMHGYMRMYWGKKILEWSKTPQEAFDTALYLNNKYELDGRDPNGFAGVAWCFGKHDRPWTERPIFGMVRYMNAQGLERKFDIEKYVEKVTKLKKSLLSAV